ncbi:MAG: DNA recombination/repair protein RecA [Piscirickettsiaceae bacterium]|nr:DNA recombination/repair protein RecA [Piscirickettsiaceae bacterium]
MAKTATKDLTDDFLEILEDAAGTPEIKGWLSTGVPQYNKILSGDYDKGLAYGRMYEIYGPSSSGKTIVAVNVMIEAQKAGGMAILVDFEHAFMIDLAVKLGLDRSKFVSIDPVTWEEGMTKALKVAEKMRERRMVTDSSPIVIVIDSIASAVPKSVLEKDLTEQTMNDTTALARATSHTLRVIAGRTSRSNITCLFLNQIRLKPGVMFGDPTTTPGGGAMEFYASARLSVSRKKIMKQVDGAKTFVGQHITAKCVKSKHTMPFQVAAIDFLFKADSDGAGYFDLTGSLIDHLTEIGVLKKSGAFIEWTDDKKYQRGKLIGHINSNKLTDELNSLLPR